MTMAYDFEDWPYAGDVYPIPFKGWEWKVYPFGSYIAIETGEEDSPSAAEEAVKNKIKQLKKHDRETD